MMLPLEMFELEYAVRFVEHDRHMSDDDFTSTITIAKCIKERILQLRGRNSESAEKLKEAKLKEGGAKKSGAQDEQSCAIATTMAFFWNFLKS